MELISLPELQKMFLDLRSETDWNVDAEMLWSYYFTAATPELLESVAAALEEKEFISDDIFESEDQPGFILELARIETHTPESLFAMNAELEALAARFEGVEYDGMEVNPITDDADCGCGGDCENCEDCEGEHQHEEHECCRGGGKHCHSEGEPIENPDLLVAIAKISSDRSEEAQHELTLALQRGLYLVPVFTGDIDTEPADDKAVHVLVCTDESGAEYLPLFTDEAALKAWTEDEVSAMVLTGPEAWDFILSQPECSGGVINPGDASLPLNRDMVTLLKKMIDGSAEE